jgi:hypothetical protein
MSSWGGGLTTYLLTLSYHNQHQIKSKKISSCRVIPTNPEAYNLKEDAKCFLLNDSSCLSVNIGQKGLYNPFPFYAYTVEFKANLFWSKPQRVYFTVQDLPNEIFENIEKSLKENRYSGRFFLNVQGYLIVMDGTSYRSDQNYADSIKKVLQSFPDRNNLPRIAFAISKCELPQLWVNRDNPRGMAKNLFPKMYAVLENWSDKENGQVEYFATSAFGVLGRGEYLEPNSRIIRSEHFKTSGTMAVIKNPNEWTPFGLVEPLYWLCTGKHL